MGAKVYRLDPTYLKKPPDRSGHNGLRIGTGGRFRYSLSSRCPQQAFRHWPVAVAFYVTHRAELDSTASTTTAIPHGPGILATCGRPYTAWYDMSQVRYIPSSHALLGVLAILLASDMDM